MLHGATPVRMITIVIPGAWKPERARFEDADNRGGGLSEDVYERWEPTGEPDVDPELVKEHNF